MTIVCTSTITLLGEQGAKSLISSLNTINSAMDAAGGKTTSKNDESKDSPKELLPKLNPRAGIWKPFNGKSLADIKDKGKKYNITDELAMEPDDPVSPVIAELIPQQSDIVATATNNNTNLQIPERSNAYLPYTADPYAVFLTPSTLPFDVYSTTLALGNNYGFGEYYGMGTLNASGGSIPEAGTVSVLALGTLVNNRKRN